MLRSIELAFWANVCFEPAKMELVGDGWSIALEDEDGLAWPGFTRIHRDESAEAQQLRLEWLIVYTSIYKCTHTTPNDPSSLVNLIGINHLGYSSSSFGLG